jgi:acetyltransferase-like isoleucine patch superfamily enzyme
MLTEIEHHFGTVIPVDVFLKAPTIETLAALVLDEPSAREAPTVPDVGPDLLRDSLIVGVKNRLLQLLALYAPGYKTSRVWLHRRRGVVIGSNVSIGLSALIETAYPKLVFVGDNVTIGMRVIIIGHLRDSTTQARKMRRFTVQIEDNAYIGPGVIILPNVTIGRGAVVAAGSVVSRSVPPSVLVRGNPAVPIAHCGVSLGGGVSYEEFVRQLRPLDELKSPETSQQGANGVFSVAVSGDLA